MRGKRRWMVWLGDAGWQIASVSGSSVDVSESVSNSGNPNDVAGLADPMHDGLIERGYRNQPILLALGSSWCVTASETVPRPRHARKRQAMNYLIEPHLPWAAEEALIDYELLGTSVFAVAAELGPMATLVNDLEARGVRVQSIVPMARLALGPYLRSTARWKSRHAVVWRHDESFELWLVDRDRPVAWNWLPNDREAVLRALRQLMLNEESAIPVVGLSLAPDDAAALRLDTEITWFDGRPGADLDFPTSGFLEGAAILDGRRESPLELRREPLVVADRRRSLRGTLRFVQFAAVVLVASIGAALALGSLRFDERRRDDADQQAALYQRLFPDRSPPVSVRWRLESELAQLRGVRGESPEFPETVSAVLILQRLLRSVPTDIRVRILEVRVENGRLYLIGHVRSHGEADRIIAALRATGFDAAAPVTHRLEKEGVEFRLSAGLAEPPPQPAPGAT